MMETTVQERPPEFDARVLAYLPGMRSAARKYCKRQEDRDDLVTDTITGCLAKWKNFREDGGMYNWIMWEMRNVVSNRTRAARHPTLVSSDLEYERYSVEGGQPHSADLSKVLSAMTERGGNVLLRHAQGETLQEIANDMGITRERARQIEAGERDRLRKKLGVM